MKYKIYMWHTELKPQFCGRDYRCYEIATEIIGIFSIIRMIVIISEKWMDHELKYNIYVEV